MTIFGALVKMGFIERLLRSFDKPMGDIDFHHAPVIHHGYVY